MLRLRKAPQVGQAPLEKEPQSSHAEGPLQERFVLLSFAQPGLHPVVTALQGYTSRLRRVSVCCRQDVQEQALVAWVNSKFPAQPESQAEPQLQAQLRRQLQRVYAIGAQYLTIIANVEERLRKGRLSLQDEVLS